jgi:hypothetical protein
VLVVSTDAPDSFWTSVHTMAGTDTSATYYSDVRATLMCGYRRPIWAGRKTKGGSWSPTS